MVRSILEERVGEHGDSHGIVVGLIDASGRRIVSVGHPAIGNARPLDGDSLFELASLTKVFTALLLAIAVERGEVALDDPAQKFLPPTVQLPQFAGRPITLRDLATHTSGLPHLPTPVHPKSWEQPYDDYSLDELYRTLASTVLDREPGTEFSYSSIGFGVLGHVLSLRAGQSYDELVRTRITEPLRMTDTATHVPPASAARLAPGHYATLEPAPSSELSASLAGAGALRSSANDQLTFLAASLGSSPSPLASALAMTATLQRPLDSKGGSMGLGWGFRSQHGKEIFWHSGGSAGYRSFMAYDRRARAGVVVLSNVNFLAGCEDIGMHLLDPESPWIPAGSPRVTPTRRRVQVALNPDLLGGYVGRYQLSPTTFIDVSRSDNQLLAQVSGEELLPVFPASTKEFFYKIIDARLSFELDARGTAAAVVLHIQGEDQRAPRADERSTPVAGIPLDPARFDRYTGRYRITPDAVVTVSRQGPRFLVRATGRPAQEVLASGEREFFLKYVDATLSFEVDAEGRGVACIIHQNGREIRAPRIDWRAGSGEEGVRPPACERREPGPVLGAHPRCIRGARRSGSPLTLPISSSEAARDARDVEDSRPGAAGAEAGTKQRVERL